MPYKDRRVYMKQYCKEHLEEKKIYNKQYYKNNREKLIEQSKQYYEGHREERKSKMKQYDKDHPEINLKSKKKEFTKLGKIFDLNHESMKYALISWSKAVRKRDGNKCTWCDSTKNLKAHHIWHKIFCPESALDVDNGITLCHTCHKEQHRLDSSFS